MMSSWTNYSVSLHISACVRPWIEKTHAVISLASSFTDVRVDATPRIHVKELPLVGEEEMTRREQERLESTTFPRPFQVIKARVYQDDPDLVRPVWKVVDQPAHNLRVGDSIYVSLKESDGFALHYAEAFTIVGEPMCMEHATEVQLMSSAGVHTPIILLLKTDWFAEEQIPVTVESTLRKFWNKLRCGGDGMVN